VAVVSQMLNSSPHINTNAFYENKTKQNKTRANDTSK
jgi:hypothetical protein